MLKSYLTLFKNAYLKFTKHCIYYKKMCKNAQIDAERNGVHKQSIRSETLCKASDKT